MREPLSVTDADILDAWIDYHARGDIPHDPVRLPIAGYTADDLMLAGFRRVLEGDRKRILERSAQT